jgi:hypothetical protein
VSSGVVRGELAGYAAQWAQWVVGKGGRCVDSQPYHLHVGLSRNQEASTS